MTIDDIHEKMLASGYADWDPGTYSEWFETAFADYLDDRRESSLPGVPTCPRASPPPRHPANHVDVSLKTDTATRNPIMSPPPRPADPEFDTAAGVFFNMQTPRQTGSPDHSRSAMASPNYEAVPLQSPPGPEPEGPVCSPGVAPNSPVDGMREVELSSVEGVELLQTMFTNADADGSGYLDEFEITQLIKAYYKRHSISRPLFQVQDEASPPLHACVRTYVGISALPSPASVLRCPQLSEAPCSPHHAWRHLEVNRAFATYDTDGNGSLDFEAALASPRPHPSPCP
jgi:hypothetical protein